MFLLLTLLPLLGPALPGGEGARASAADLRKLREWVDLERSFTDASREAARKAVEGHLEQATEFTEAEFYMEVRRIVGLA